MLKSPIWQVRPVQTELARLISSELNVSLITAQVLVARGATSVQVADQLLNVQHQAEHSPWLLPAMNTAVDRVAQAVQTGEHIMVYGDYDVDGQTATALMVRVLRRLGAAADYYIPSRMDEGYGLHSQAVRDIAATGCTLIITVDCGTTAAAEIKLAHELGVDCVVTDHHEPAGTIAAALAVINPKLPGSRYPWPNLAGVGVAYKLAAALTERLGLANGATDLLDLVAVGTIADVVPIMDENRLLAHLGLQKINMNPLPGLAALAAASSLAPGQIESYNVAFHMAPRLNAGGRIAHAAAGVQMLLAPTMAEALPFAEKLDQENRTRQSMEEQILREAKAMAEKCQDDPVLLVAGTGWHPGVIGIVASRLVDLYGRPACVLACEGSTATASGRSVPGFHLTNALEQNAALLQRYGGHAMAAGFTIHTDNIAALRQALGAAAVAELGLEPPPPVLDIDTWVDLADLDLGILQELERLGPFGYGNSAPVLACREVTPKAVRTVGKEGTVLRLTLPVGRSQLTAVGFRMGHLAAQINSACDLAFILTLNEWQGRQSLELRLRDVRSCVAKRQPALEQIATGNGEVAAAACVGTPNNAGAPANTLVAGIPCYDAQTYAERRVAYIQQLLQRDLHPLVWTGTAADAQTLQDELEQNRLGSAVAIAHPQSIVPAQPGKPWCLVFCHPPVGQAWRKCCAHLQANVIRPAEAHLLYSASSKQAAQALLPAEWPDRESLVLVYRELQRLRPGVTEAAATANMAARTGLSENGLRLALQVFAELGIVDAERRFTLRPHPGSKLDLKVSVSYNDSVIRRQEDGNILAANTPQVMLAQLLSGWAG